MAASAGNAPDAQDQKFTFASISVRATALSVPQKKLFDEIWNYFVITDKPFPLRSLPRVIGKQSIPDAFRGLNGSLIFETTEQGDRCFSLTAYGVLLSGHGTVLAVLLLRLLDLVKDLYVQDSYIKSIDSDTIKQRLGIGDAEATLLFKLLRLGLPVGMPFYLGNWVADGSSWGLTITDNVIGLFGANEAKEYFDERFSSEYSADKPMFYSDRMRLDAQSAVLVHPISEGPGSTYATQSAHATSSIISASRLDELRRVKNEHFDCTRLITLCEELNACACRGNAHAVIMLSRAILDHVPPVFGFKKFVEVASSYNGGGGSFRKAIDRLENHSRKVADRLLHMPIRSKEVSPTMHEVSFSQELETILTEFCRLLK